MILCNIVVLGTETTDVFNKQSSTKEAIIIPLIHANNKQINQPTIPKPEIIGKYYNILFEYINRY